MIFFKKTTCGGHQSVRLGRALYAKNSPRYRPPSLVRSVLPAPGLRFKYVAVDATEAEICLQGRFWQTGLG